MYKLGIELKLAMMHPAEKRAACGTRKRAAKHASDIGIDPLH
jgi:hypothetical protein